MNISRVEPQDAPVVLKAVGPQVLDALSRGQGDTVTPAQALEAITEGRHQLWAVHDEKTVHAAVGVSVEDYPACRKVWVSMLAGRRMFEWADLVESALKKCRELTQSKCVEASCRPDLARYLERRGWKVKAVIMEAPQ